MAASATRLDRAPSKRRSGQAVRRSLRERIVRGSLAALVAIIGYFCVTFSIAQVVVKADPERAHRLASYDGRITARLAAKLTGSNAIKADRQRADDLARLALRQDATTVSAASALGLNEQTKGDASGARRLFTYAEKLSRRDPVAQLWLIEDAVTHGDIPGALRHYDIALRTKPSVSDLLFPILTAASSEPAIRNGLIQTLLTKPTWGEPFINFVAVNSRDPNAVAALFMGLSRAGVRVPQAAQGRVIDTLLAKGDADEAWAYYASIRAGADRRRSRDPQFASRLETPSQFDWVAINADAVATSMEGGLFDFAVPASVGGTLLQQAQVLPAGKYRLSGHSQGVAQHQTAAPYWVLTCRDGRELGRLDLPNSDQARGNFAGTFVVPVDCPQQSLILMARPSEAIGGLSGQIDRAALVPM